MSSISSQLQKMNTTALLACQLLALCCQVRTTLLTFKVLSISTALLWLLFTDSCWSYVTTWLGTPCHPIACSPLLTWQAGPAETG